MHKAALHSCLPLSTLAAVAIAFGGLAGCDAELTTPTAAAGTDDVTVVAEPLITPAIVPSKEFLVTALSVVDDRRFSDYHPGRWNGDEEGAFSFGRLVDNMIASDKPSDAARSAFVMNWMRTWETPQTVNGQTLAARRAVRDVLITPWKLRSIGRLGNTPQTCSASPTTDFQCKLSFGPNEIPFELTAIVNRPDLRVVPTTNDGKSGSAGQGRFVFVLVDAERQPLPFTVIFEYMVPTANKQDIKTYAEQWHRMGKRPFGSAFNHELHVLTQRFARRGAAPWRNSGSALLQLRTNEVMFAAPDSDPRNPFGGSLWELREFVLGSNGQLTPDTVKMEPALSLSGSATLGQWASENAAAIVAGTFELPPTYRGKPFLAASSQAAFEFVWDVPGVSEEVRDSLALNTCNGCHVNETGTGFLHVFPAEAGAEAELSPFLTEQLTGPRSADFMSVLASDWGTMQDGRGRDRGHPPARP